MQHILAPIFLALIAACYSCSQSSSSEKEAITLVWTDSITDDFSFSKTWEYPEGVYRNGYGQLSCDGFCPPETEAMKDRDGKIYTDSLSAFYAVVDTTHLYHSLESETSAPEWGNSDFIDASKKGKDTIECYSLCNASTHSSLHLSFIKTTCNARIVLNSIIPHHNATFPCAEGIVQIDQTLFHKGILKAKFNLNFVNLKNPKQSLYWKGKIYTRIHSN